MKNLRVISVFATVIIIVAIIINVPETSGNNQNSTISRTNYGRDTIIATYDSMESIVRRMQVTNTAIIPHNVHPIASPQATPNNLHTQEITTTVHPEVITRSLNRLQKQITSNRQQSLESNSNEKAKTESTKDFSVETFWIKVIISFIICVVALFIILTKKYNEETQKWAFSALTLIAGAWIGKVI